MQAEKYLEQIKKIDAIISNKLKEYKRWVDVADGMGGFSVGDRVLSSRNLHKGSDAIAEYIDIESEINALKARKKAILDTIQQLPYTEYQILYKIYVEGYMLKELPSQFDRSYDWVRMKKRKALEMLQDILDQ